MTAETEQNLLDDFRGALASRDVIGQAKGMLMERHGIDADEAFARLVASPRTPTRSCGTWPR